MADIHSISNSDVALCYLTTNRWYNRVGCFCDARMRPAYDYENTALNSAQKAANGINFFVSVLGSLAYLLGSIAYIPAVNALQSGQWLFIYGSALIAASQAAKVLRTCLAQDYTVATAATTGTASYADAAAQSSSTKQQQISSSSSSSSWSFQLSHALQDVPALGVDAFAGIGGVFYLVGTALSLPSSCDESDPVCAQLYATIFIAGGASFLLSGLFLNYRYFCCSVAMHGAEHSYSII